VPAISFRIYATGHPLRQVAQIAQPAADGTDPVYRDVQALVFRGSVGEDEEGIQTPRSEIWVDLQTDIDEATTSA